MKRKDFAALLACPLALGCIDDSKKASGDAGLTQIEPGLIIDTQSGKVQGDANNGARRGCADSSLG
jgi:hypothetical protein